jgi:UDP:flavonoid glycosyltransferase YjiC (YdhE family)
MTRLGVARRLPWRRASTRRLVTELSALLLSDRYRQNALAVQARVAGEDGLGETMRAVERILAG